MLKVLLGAMSVIVRRGELRRQRRDGDVLRAAEKQVAVDFVRDDGQVVPEAQLGHRGQLLPGEDAADRVVRVAEGERAGAVGDRRGHLLRVQRVATVGLAGQRHRLEHLSGAPRRVDDGPVDRRLHQRPISRLRCGAGGYVQSDDKARHEDDRLGRHRPGIALLQARDEHLAQFRRLTVVAENPMLDALVERADHRLRRGEVHVGDPERKDVGAKGPPFFAVGVPAVDDTVEVVGHVCGCSWKNGWRAKR